MSRDPPGTARHALACCRGRLLLLRSCAPDLVAPCRISSSQGHLPKKLPRAPPLVGGVGSWERGVGAWAPGRFPALALIPGLHAPYRAWHDLARIARLAFSCCSGALPEPVASCKHDVQGNVDGKSMEEVAKLLMERLVKYTG